MELGEHAFTLSRPDGTNLRATFVAPGNVTLTRPNRTSTYGMYGGLTNITDHDHPQRSTQNLKADRKLSTHRWNSVMATGGDTFFVVATLQDGKAPAVSVDGAGLDAVVTIGQQTVRWDGTKIVLQPISD